MSPKPLPGLPDVVIERDVPCRMRDGVSLLADVYQPTEGPSAGKAATQTVLHSRDHASRVTLPVVSQDLHLGETAPLDGEERVRLGGRDELVDQHVLVVSVGHA